MNSPAGAANAETPRFQHIAPVIVLALELEHNQALLRCVIAEEPEHHSTSAGDMLCRPYRSNMGCVFLSKAEKRVLRWAAELVMPPMEVAAVAREVETVHDLVERFGVTPGFVRAAFQLPLYAKVLDMLRVNMEAM